jgi:membrane fusion protein, multidrug efflux system
MTLRFSSIRLHPAVFRLTGIFFMVWLAALVAGCSTQENPPQEQHSQQKSAAEKKPDTAVAVSAAFKGDIASYYESTATLEAEKQADILARATGIASDLQVEEGDLVRKGQVLLRIENPEYRLRLQQAEARTANLRSRFERFESMRAEDLATEEEFEAARSELASAEADDGLARLNLSYTEVEAPFSGIITSRLVSPGQNLNNGDILFVLADFEPLLARVHVPAREFRKLLQNQVVDLELDSDASEMEGHISLISPVIDPTSGTIKVTVQVTEYPPQTRPGDFARVSIVTELREGRVLVPRTAVVNEKGNTVVYLVGRKDDRDVAERRAVTVGFTDKDNTEIIKGLASGEVVIVRGQRSLKNGAPVKVLDNSENGSGS